MPLISSRFPLLSRPTALTSGRRHCFEGTVSSSSFFLHQIQSLFLFNPLCLRAIAAMRSASFGCFTHWQRSLDTSHTFSSTVTPVLMKKMRLNSASSNSAAIMSGVMLNLARPGRSASIEVCTAASVSSSAGTVVVSKRSTCSCQ